MASETIDQAASADAFVEKQIARTGTQVKLVELISAVMFIGTAVLAYFLLFAVVDHWILKLGSLGRWIGLLLLLAGVAHQIWTRIVPLLIHRINPTYSALTIERNYPSLKNSLVNFLLLRRTRGVHASVFKIIEEKAANDLRSNSADAAVDRSRLITMGYVLAGVFAVCAVYAVASPKSPLQSIRRVVMPWASIDRPARYAIKSVEPGDLTTYQGATVDISAIISGPSDGRVELVYRTLDGQIMDRRVPMTLSESKLRHVCTLPEEGDDGLKQSIVYRIVVGDAVSSEYRLTVEPAPTILVDHLQLKYPAYTKRPDRTINGSADISALEGTQVVVHGRANFPIRSAILDLNLDAKPINLPMSRGKTELLAQREFVLRLASDGRTPEYHNYRLRFTSKGGQSSRDDIVHRIDVTRDLAPEIEILAPRLDYVEVRETGRLLIEIRALDPDFATQRVRLRAVSGNTDVLNKVLVEGPREGQVVARYEFRPRDLGLKGGERVQVRAIAEDNRTNADGSPRPNVSRTRNFTIAVTKDPDAVEPSGKDNKAAENPDGNLDKVPAENASQADKRKARPNKSEPGKKQDGTQKQDGQKNDAGQQNQGKQNQGKQNQGKQNQGKQDQGKQDQGKQDQGKQDQGKQDQGQGGQDNEQPKKESQGQNAGQKTGDGSSSKGRESGQQESGDGSKGQGGSAGDQKGSQKGDQGTSGQGGQKGSATESGDANSKSSGQPGDPSRGGQGQPSGDDQDGDKFQRILDKLREKERQEPGSQKSDGKKDGSQQGTEGGKKDGSQQGTEGGKKDGNQQGTEGGKKDGSQQGTEGGKKDGSQQGTEGGKKDGSQQGTEGGKKDGSQQGTEGGKKDGSQQGTEGGKKDGSQQGTEGGKKDGSQQGTEGGKKDGSQQGTEGGKKDGSQQGTEGGKKDGGKQGTEGGKKDGGKQGAGQKNGKKQGGQDGGKQGGGKKKDGKKDGGKKGGKKKGGQGGDDGKKKGGGKQGDDDQQSSGGGKQPDQGKKSGGSKKSEGNGGDEQTPGNDKKKSDSQSASNGDRSGDGEKGQGQQGKRKGNDTAGSSSASDSGNAGANEPGNGDESQQGGGTKKTDRKTGQQGREKGNGSKKRSSSKGRSPGGNSSPDKSAQQGKKSKQQQSKGRNRSAADASNDGGGVPSDTPKDELGLPKEIPDTENARLEYAKMATAKVLEYLKHNKDNAQALKDINLTRKDADRMIKHYDRARKSDSAAGSDDFDDQLRSLGLQPRQIRGVRRTQVDQNQRGGLQDAGTRIRVPKGLIDDDLFNAFIRGAARGEKK